MNVEVVGQNFLATSPTAGVPEPDFVDVAAPIQAPAQAAAPLSSPAQVACLISLARSRVLWHAISLDTDRFNLIRG